MSQVKRFLIDNKNIIGFEDVPRTGAYTLFNVPYYMSWRNAKASTLTCLLEQIEAVKTYDFRYQIAKKFNTDVNYPLLNANNETVGSIQCTRLRIAKVTIAAYCEMDAYGHGYIYKEVGVKASWTDYPDPYLFGLTDVSTWVKFDVICYDFTNVFPARYMPSMYKCNVWFNSVEPRLIYTKDDSTIYDDGYGELTVCGIDSYQEFTTDPTLPSGWYMIFDASYESSDGNTSGSFIYYKINIGILCTYRTSSDALRLDFAHNLFNYPSDDHPYWAEYLGGHYHTIDISDVVNLDGAPIPEEGFMNELMERFSPRRWAGSLGLYKIPESQIATVMSAMMNLNVNGAMLLKFFGTDGKQYVMSCRWYYGMEPSTMHPNATIKLADNQRREFKCGTVYLTDENDDKIYAYMLNEFALWQTSVLTVPEHFGNYLDYESRYQLYLPYYGFLDISANDIVGGTIQVFYNINLVTGMSTIQVVCKNARNSNLATKYYTVTAKVGVDVPFGSDMMKTWAAAGLETCGQAFITGASMGAYGATQEYMNYNPENSSQHNAIKDMLGFSHGMSDEKAEKGANTILNAGATAKYTGSQIGNAMNMFQSASVPTRSNGCNDETGSMDELHPYLLITRPVSVEPATYENYVGMPSSEAVSLNTCSGFTQIAAVAPESIIVNANAPRDSEMNEIISLLQAGVYL